MYSSQLVLSYESLHFAFSEIACRLVVIDLRTQQLENDLASMNFVFNLAQLAVYLHESLTMLVNKLHDLLAGPFLDPLHPAKFLLQQQEVNLWTLPTAFLFGSGFAQCQQISRQVQLLGLQLHPIHQLQSLPKQSSREMWGMGSLGNSILWPLEDSNSNQYMGTTHPSPDNSWLHDRYAFVQNTTVPHLGPVAVFKKKQENYDYVALVKRVVRRDYLKEIQRELCCLTSKSLSLPFLKIFQVEVGKLDLQDAMIVPPRSNSPLCCQDRPEQGLSIYMELLTYSLHDHLNYKRDVRQEVPLREYAYVLKTAVAAAQLYQEWRLDYLQLDLSSEAIFLKPNGEIKLLPFRSKFVREVPQCGEDCTPQGCVDGKDEWRSYSFPSPKKKQGKYLRQIKQLALQLLSTINLKIDSYVRSIPNFNRHAILSLEELKTLQALHFAILQASSLKELYLILGEVEDEMLQLQVGQGSAEVQINNPEVYQAFLNHLSTLSSFQKPKQSPQLNGKHQHVTRNIFGIQPLADSDSNTHSNLSPRSHHKRSFSRCIERQPQISLSPSSAHSGTK